MSGDHSSSSTPPVNPYANILAALTANPQDPQSLAAAQQLACMMAGSFTSQQPQRAPPPLFSALNSNAFQTAQPSQVADFSVTNQPQIAQAAALQWSNSPWPDQAALSHFISPLSMLSMMQQTPQHALFPVPSAPISMFADVHRFAAPILPSDSSDAAVAERLRKYNSEGKSAKDALNSMHGVRAVTCQRILFGILYALG
jgi:hypothetical protein